MITKEELLDAIGMMLDPHLHKPFSETGGIKNLEIVDDGMRVNLTLALQKKDTPEAKTLKTALLRLLKIDHKIPGVHIDFVDLQPKEFGTILDPERKVRFLGVASGKGGVGKSTVAANLAVTFARMGYKVALVDADIYGPSIPSIFDIPLEIPDASVNEKAIPVTKLGVEIMSTAVLTGDQKPLVWRGPMLNQMLDILFFQVDWNPETQLVIIDLPPGTGDVALDLQKLIPSCDMVIVTTPHPAAATIAHKAGESAKMLKHRVLGVIENMSFFPNPVNGQKEFIFGRGGGTEVATTLDVPLLGQLPIGQPKKGVSHSIYAPDEDAALVYFTIANKITKFWR